MTAESDRARKRPRDVGYPRLARSLVAGLAVAGDALARRPSQYADAGQRHQDPKEPEHEEVSCDIAPRLMGEEGYHDDDEGQEDDAQDSYYQQEPPEPARALHESTPVIEESSAHLSVELTHSRDRRPRCAVPMSWSIMTVGIDSRKDRYPGK